MDTIDLDEISIKEKIKLEIERNRKFQLGILGVKEKSVKVTDIDIRNYAKFILLEGDMEEKREFFKCLKSRILLANKVIKLA